MTSRTFLSWFVIAMTTQLVITPAAIFAVPITYNVDHSATSQGHILRVLGTITAETTSNMLIGSDLSFIHESDTPIGLPSLPSGDGDFMWNATLGELRFIKPSDLVGGAQTWYVGGDTTAVFSLSSGNVLAYIDPTHDLDDITNFGVAQDFPGFLVGIAVPEPSALTLVVFAVAGISVCRNNQSALNARATRRDATPSASCSRRTLQKTEKRLKVTALCW